MTENEDEHKYARIRLLIRDPARYLLTYLNAWMQHRRPEQALTLSELVLEHGTRWCTLHAVSHIRKTENRTRIRLR